MTVALQQPPGPKERFPGSHLMAFRRDPLGLLARLAEEYGDIAHVRFGPRNVVLLNHAE